MPTQKYQAAKTRSNRPGWCVTFKHPKRSDSRGKMGLKLRKSLKTQDDADADILVSQLNELLANERWWSLDRRKEAELQFDPLIAGIFFDGMESGTVDSRSLRDQKIPLPGWEHGYSRILITGATGAGKTTLLRHVIGTSHQDDRFPSTSTARTTTAEIEIVIAEGSFDAVVTFMPEHEVRAHIDQCLEEACLRAVQEQSDEKIMGSLLTHHEQKFRLSYVLGSLSQEAASPDDDFAFDDIADECDNIGDGEAVPTAEIASNRARLLAYLEAIKRVALRTGIRTADDIGTLASQTGADERAAWLELFGEALYDDEGFAKIANDLIDDISDRFDFIDSGIFEKESTGWPVAWSFSHPSKEDFLRQIRWFSSNHHRQFGRLLTPLVNAMRVRGPFYPAKSDLHVAPKLVLLDSVGIGHSTKTASSISTDVTRRFPELDLIVLVDSSQQPMQSAPLELLRTVGSSGHGDKLAVAFTHFDLVKGPNLGTHQQKCDHILNSTRDAIANLRQSLGAPVASSLENRIEKHSFFLGGLDREIGQIPSGFLRQMRELMKLMQESGEPTTPIDCAPIYSGEGLEIALRDAVEGFLEPWRARLGKTYHDGIPKEHWSRIKALARYVAVLGKNEYSDLRPVADLVARLQENISRWLDNPASWTRPPQDDAERNAALAGVRQTVFAALHDMAEIRMKQAHLSDWSAAYEHSGPRSSYRRADEIERIYEESAPPISSAMSHSARTFLHALHNIVRESVEKSGGQFRANS
jgi:energy-coupling factor transporter ATP-binding protein EcfA2